MGECNESGSQQFIWQRLCIQCEQTSQTWLLLSMLSIAMADRFVQTGEKREKNRRRWSLSCVRMRVSCLLKHFSREKQTQCLTLLAASGAQSHIFH